MNCWQNISCRSSARIRIAPMSTCRFKPLLSFKSITGRAIAGKCKMLFSTRWSNARKIQSNPNIYRQHYLQVGRTGMLEIFGNPRLMSRRFWPRCKKLAVTNAKLPRSSGFPDPLCIASSTGIAGNLDSSGQYFSEFKPSHLPLIVISVRSYVPFHCPVVPPILVRKFACARTNNLT